MDMRAIIYAHGPTFKTNYTSPTFSDLDIWTLICELLELISKPVDGSIDHVRLLPNK